MLLSARGNVLSHRACRKNVRTCSTYGQQSVAKCDASISCATSRSNTKRIASLLSLVGARVRLVASHCPSVSLCIIDMHRTAASRGPVSMIPCHLVLRPVLLALALAAVVATSGGLWRGDAHHPLSRDLLDEPLTRGNRPRQST
eukprot:scaffold1535_cov382-Prasinococcus_capsulatus_cf.AAC.14